jgi:hypothetical protein
MQDAIAAVDRLRAAVWATRPDSEWATSDTEVFDLVQGSIVRWVDELGNTFTRLAQAIATASDETDIEALEDALVRAVSARDKVRSIGIRVLGPGSLKLYKQSVRFDPAESSLRRALSEAAADGITSAGRAKTLFEQLADHPAVLLRNDVVHALSPLTEIADICWVKTAHLDERGGITYWNRSALYPEGTLEQANLLPETLYAWALGCAVEVSDLLVETASALAEVIESAGVIVAIPKIYRWPDGRYQLEDPRS